MPRVVCRYIDCIYLESGMCGAESILVDPDEGCTSYSSVNDPDIDLDWEDDVDAFGGQDDDEDEIIYDDDDDWMEDTGLI